MSSLNVLQLVNNKIGIQGTSAHYILCFFDIKITLKRFINWRP